MGRRPVGSEVGRAEGGGLAGALTRAWLARSEPPRAADAGKLLMLGPLLDALDLSLGRHLWAALPSWAGTTPFWHHPSDSRARKGWGWHFLCPSGSPGEQKPQGPASAGW